MEHLDAERIAKLISYFNDCQYIASLYHLDAHPLEIAVAMESVAGQIRFAEAEKFKSVELKDQSDRT